jgi:hypothetical protein
MTAMKVKTRLADLKLTKAEKKETGGMPEGVFQSPDYSYGTRLSLGTAELDKLDLDASKLKLGPIKMQAEGEIMSVRSESRKDTTDQSVEIQITRLAIKGMDSFEEGWEDD